MVAQRRVGPLLVVLAFALAVVLARAFQVQVLQHGLWAGEAAGMLRDSEILPYHRGRILARDGQVLAVDEDRRRIELVYRDFRRGNPIAELAHARSSLEMRAVGLVEAERNLEAWARELVGLAPRDLESFARGGALAGAAAIDPAAARGALRERRASDLRYYAAELLELPARARPRLKPDPESPDAGLTLLELAARARSVGVEALRQDLERRLAQCRQRLARLAEVVERDAGTPAGAGASALERLLDTLERERRAIEDEIADALFESAAGFEPGRVSTRLLETRLDNAWIGRLLRWDDARRREWTASRRERWERIAAEVLLPRVLLRAQMEEIRARCADRLLSELALLWAPAADELRRDDGQPRSWRELDLACVLAELDSLFVLPEGASTPRVRAASLVLQDPSLDELARKSEDRWSVLGALADLARGAAIVPRVRALPAGWRPPAGPLEAAERWRRLAADKRRLDGDEALAELSWLFFALEARFQEGLEREFDRFYEQAGAGEPLAFAAERIARALEAEPFAQRDRSTRPVIVCETPSWELVELVTRQADDFRGLAVRTTTERVHPATDARGAELARPLVGSVRRPSLADLLRQGRDRRRLSALQSQLVRNAAEEDEIRGLVARLYRNDEWTGGTGLESYLDGALRGSNGYQETLSLEDEVRAEDGRLARAPVDGADVRLTLDLELQRAAQDVLANPVMPEGDASDQLWCRHPVGAIVLLTPEGDVLAAASEPTRDGLPSAPGRDHERSVLRERTLQRPTLNPPGSCFKSFVAAFALDRLGFDPGTSYACSPLSDGGHGYQSMHCHGHGTVALRDALVKSCNAYFAQLAEHAYTPAEFLAMAHQFGFGEPTGVRCLGDGGGAGLREHYLLPSESGLPRALADRANAMRFACGLAPMEATPMQVARATAALVHGELPELRLVQQIGGEPVPRRARPLGISAAALAFVRDAMVGVVAEPGGTAYGKGLDEKSLGFRFACKTGSADVGSFLDTPELTEADRADMLAGKSRKHAWIAGWFPAEDPKAVLVVYLHEVSETASHSSVWIAAQFLRHEAVQRFACGEGSAR